MRSIRSRRGHRVTYRPVGDPTVFFDTPASVATADRVLRQRLGAAMNANIYRNQIGHALRLRSALIALHRLLHSDKQHRDAWIEALLFSVRRAKREFEEAARDAPTLAAAHEVEGLVTAVIAIEAALNGCRYAWPNPFECQIPAEIDPVAGPAIRDQAAQWRAAATN